MRSLVASCVVALLGVSVGVTAKSMSSSLAFFSIPYQTPSNYVSSAHHKASHLLATHLPIIQHQLNHFHTHLSTQLSQHHSNFHAMDASATPSSSSSSSSSCSDAINLLQAKLVSCGLPFGVNSTYITPSPSPTVLASQIQSMCSTGTCASDLSALVQNAGVQCAAPPTEYASIQSLLLGLCMQDAQGNFCVPQLLNMISSSSITSNVNTITNAQLNVICTPCTMKALALFVPSSSSASTTTAFQMLCIKDPTDSTGSGYCFPKLAAVIGSSSSTTASPTTSCSTSSSSSSSPPTTAQIDALCSPCMRRLLQYALQLEASSSSSSSSSSACPTTSSSSDILVMVDGMCGFNSNGQRCFDLFLNIASQKAVITAAGVACSSSSSTYCSSGCSAAYSNMMAPFGCCWGTLMNLEGSSTSTLQQIGTACGVNLASCPPSASTPVTLTLTLPALSYSWCVANLNSCQSSLQTDIANAAFVSPSSVTLSVWPFGNGGTKVTVSIKANSNVDAVAAQNTLNADLLQGGSTFVLTQTTAAATAGGGLILSASSSGLIIPSPNSTNANGATNNNGALAATQPTHTYFVFTALLSLAVAFKHF